jgi:hypothetical protein
VEEEEQKSDMLIFSVKEKILTLLFLIFMTGGAKWVC